MSQSIGAHAEVFGERGHMRDIVLLCANCSLVHWNNLQSGLSRVLQELVAEDYVVQTPGPTDRRERRLKLTAKGESLEQLLTEGQRRRLGRAYAQAGQEAVKAFQKARHLTVDGVVGKDTWARLRACLQWCTAPRLRS